MSCGTAVKCPICGNDTYCHIVSATTAVDRVWRQTLSGYPVVIVKSEYDLKCWNCDSEITIRGTFETLENWRRKNAKTETDPDP